MKKINDSTGEIAENTENDNISIKQRLYVPLCECEMLKILIRSYRRRYRRPMLNENMFSKIISITELITIERYNNNQLPITFTHQITTQKCHPLPACLWINP